MTSARRHRFAMRRPKAVEDSGREAGQAVEQGKAGAEEAPAWQEAAAPAEVGGIQEPMVA
jgi:hypothetical protein